MGSEGCLKREDPCLSEARKVREEVAGGWKSGREVKEQVHGLRKGHALRNGRTSMRRKHWSLQRATALKGGRLRRWL